jgi:antitoxin component of MazEF toxin-antitoxin module
LCDCSATIAIIRGRTSFDVQPRLAAGEANSPPPRGRQGSTVRGGSPASDICVYTELMRIVRVRRVGNSNVVSIPREFEASGYSPGSSVLVEELADGELRILPTDRVRERVRQTARRVIDEHPEALEILANHDPDNETPSA